MNTKHLLLVICAFFAITATNASAQNKKKAIKATLIRPATPVLKNQNDSITYLYGIVAPTGLDQYLMQSNVLIDTSAISAEYNYKISIEDNKKELKRLNSEFVHKMDSAIAANTANMDSFIGGLTKGLYSAESDKSAQMGLMIGSQLLNNLEPFAKEVLGDERIMVDKGIFMHAFVNTLTGDQLVYNVEDAQQELQNLAQKKKEDKALADRAAFEEKYTPVKERGERFLAENRTKKGIIELPSGLQYQIITEGNGKIAKRNDAVKVHYEGTLIDGTVFDSSYERGDDPVALSVSYVIQGWTEALQLMPVGSKWKLFIPYKLAYGDKEQRLIEPYSALVFTVELIEVIEAEKLMEENKALQEE